MRIQEYNALQLGEQGFFVLAGQPAHVVHIHMGLFPDGERQCFYCRIHLFGRFMAANCALCEQVSLALQIFLLIQHFQ